MAKTIPYTKAEKAFLEANCTMTRAELTVAFNTKFNRNLSQQNIAAMCKRNKWLTGRTGQFPKGHIPWTKDNPGVVKPNAGNFKKGSKPHNSVPVGTEVVADGWVKVKVAEPNVWRNKAHLVWEEHHGQPIPEGKLLLHLDGDFTNYAIENLVLVSRAEMGKLNKKKFKETPLEVRPAIVTLACVETAIKERQRNES